MTADHIDLFVRWARRAGASGTHVRTCFTIAFLIGATATLPQLREALGADGLDEQLLKEFASLATAQETAELLCSRIGPSISPGLFQHLLEKSLINASGEMTSRLMFAAGMFLDNHPNAFELPRKLVKEVLASNDVDQRLGGLKALRHCGAAIEDIMSYVVVTLQRKDEHEQAAGLSLLTQLLIEHEFPAKESPSMATTLTLRKALTHIDLTAGSSYVRSMARNCLAMLPFTP